MRTPLAIGRLEAAPARERIGTTHRPRAVLLLACCAHFVHDGFADILYVLLPLWAREFGLAFVQVGAIRTVYSGAMALFQIPAGLLAERWGERRLLAAGTAVTGAGFIAAGWTGGFASLLLVLLVAGRGRARRRAGRLARGLRRLGIPGDGGGRGDPPRPRPSADGRAAACRPPAGGSGLGNPRRAGLRRAGRHRDDRQRDAHAVPDLSPLHSDWQGAHDGRRRPGAGAPLRGRGRRQVRLRAGGGAHRRDPRGDPDRGRDRRRHRRRRGRAPAHRARPPGPARHRAERHLVGAVRDRGRSGVGRPALAGLRTLLHDHPGRLGARTHPLRDDQRPRRRHGYAPDRGGAGARDRPPRARPAHRSRGAARDMTPTATVILIPEGDGTGTLRGPPRRTPGRGSPIQVPPFSRSQTPRVFISRSRGPP